MTEKLEQLGEGWPRSARDGLALLGTSDGSALTDFLHEFFAGEDPGNESPGTS